MKPKSYLNILTLFILLLKSTAAFSQEVDDDFIDPAQNQIDSLLNLADTAVEDSVKAKSYTEIAFITSSVDTCLKYAHLSLKYCRETDSLLKAKNYDYLGFAYWMQDESRTALTYLFNAVDLFNKTSRPKAAAHTFLIIGSCYEDLNIRDSIFPYYNMAIKYYVEAQDTANLIMAYNGLGRIYDNMSLYDNAEETYRKALTYALAANDTVNAGWCYNNIGSSMGSKSEIDSAIENLTKSVYLFEAISYLNYDDIQYKYDAYSNLANIYIQAAKSTGKKEFADSCYKYVKKAGNFFLSIGADYDYISHRYTFIEYLIFYKRYNDALTELLKMETFITANSSISVLKNYNDYLYQVYSLLGDYKNALKHHEKLLEYKLSTLNDSTLDVIKNSEVERTRMLEEVKRENAEKLHAAETARYKSDRNTMIVIIAALIAGLLLIFRIFWDKPRQTEFFLTKTNFSTPKKPKSKLNATKSKVRKTSSQSSGTRLTALTENCFRVSTTPNGFNAPPFQKLKK
ncbi:MAG: tetratricopeptide repeat protein [Bacteroidales bacterium]|nr:tetratricopeptide repeat protein [Bacteroidales bacterium]